MPDQEEVTFTLETLLEVENYGGYRGFNFGEPKAQAGQTAQQTAAPNYAPVAQQTKLAAELGLEFKDLTYTVVKHEKVHGKWESTAVDLLQKISGKAVRGQLTGIMGPSGAGKSTFLDALAGRIEQRSLRGTVHLDGKQVTGSYIKRSSAYVMQEDLLFPFLTVAETLMFSADVRLPSKLSRSQKAERVEALITQLGLESCADTYVGDENKRGISGGEKRRVSIGVDIIHRPSLLFLDEPTSGLDSTSAFIVMEKLSDIARAGSTILLTIHQPSYRIQMMFGRMIILARGNVVYQGAPANLAGYIEALGYEIPKNENNVEYFIELIKDYDQSDTGLDPLVQFQRDGVKTPVHGKSPFPKSISSTPLVRGELDAEDGGFDHSLTNLRTPRTRQLSMAHDFYTGKPFLSVSPTRFTPTSTLNPESSPVRTLTSLAASFSPLSAVGSRLKSRKALWEVLQESVPNSQHPTIERERMKSTDSSGVAANGSKYQNGWLREVTVLMRRSAKNVIRTPELFISRTVKAALLSVLLATVLINPKRDLEGINKRIAYFVFVIALILFSCNDALPAFIEERYIFIKETSSKAYRASSYTVANLLVYLPANALQAITYVLIAWWALKLDGGIIGFLILTLDLFALVVTSNSFAILVSVLVPNFVAGYAVVIALSALSVITSGYFVKRSQIPIFWQWLHYMSTMKYALEAAMQNEFRADKCFSGVKLLPTPGPLGNTTSFTPLLLPNGTASDCYLYGAGVVKSLDMTQFTIAEDLAFIVLWGLVYRLLLYITLRFYSKSQRK